MCIRACPAEYLPDLRHDEDTVRGYVYTNTDLGAKELLPPCVAACPLGQQVREYVQLLSDGKVKEALLVIRQDNPLPGVCGYVCHHPCEQACVRGSWDDPVAIRELKRYAVHYEIDHQEEIIEALKGRKKPAQGKKVVIVGAGPAGLACAFELAMQGYTITVMDALAQPGGMLRIGIPPFRLPRDILDHDIEVIRSLGVQFLTQVSINKDMQLDILQKGGAGAGVLAVGNQKSIRLGIPGEESEGYIDWLSFLRKINTGLSVELEGRVLVVGGGNVAIDVARCALRVGAKSVEVLSLEKEEEMPADHLEVKEAKKEGIKFRFQLVPIAVLKTNGSVKGLTCTPASLGWDELGRRMPVILEGEPFRVEGDFIISAIGQVSELSFLKAESISERGAITLGKDGRVYCEMQQSWHSALVAVPYTVVEAIASGKATARNVIRYLEGSGE